MERQPHELLSRAIRTAKVGVTAGALLTTLAVAGLAATRTGPWHDTLGAMLVVAVLYLAGGAVAGAIVGALLPLTRTPLGLFAAVVAAVTPFFAALLYFVYGFSWSVEATIVLLIAAPSFAAATTFAWRVLGGRRPRS